MTRSDLSAAAANCSELIYGLWFAFIAGSIVASGTVSDLPRISTTRAIPTFLAGALGYTVLLLLVDNLSG